MKKLASLIILFSIFNSISCQTPNPKRGLSFEYGNIKVADIEAMSGKLSWYYNWGTSAESNVEGILVENNVEYVPMTWNHNFNATNLRNYYSNHPESKYLLGFNEPNFLYQANLTPSEAAAEWPKLEAIADEFGLEIVGPAVNWCGDCVSEGGTTYYNPYEYLDDFFAACPDCQVDYIAVHNYMCYTSPLVDYLKAFNKYGKKIWLTEYACWDQATITLKMQKDLMLGSLDYMDNDTMIHKYAWFMARAGSNAPHLNIFESTGGVPTELGELYLNFNSTHDTSLYRTIPGRIEAESYSDGYEVQLELTTDFDGVANVGWIDGGDFLEYNIDVPELGDYYLYCRVAAMSNTSTEVWINDQLSGTMDITSTSGWQNWKTLVLPVSLLVGESKLKFTTATGGFNVNWITISKSENTAPTVSAGDDLEITLPQASVSLVGDVNDDDGDDLQYKWVKRAGGNCTIQSPDSASTTISAMVKGTYTFRLSISDGLDVAYDDVKVIVNGPVGLKHTELNGYAVYPNPVNNLLTIELPAEGDAYNIEVLNASGQILSKAQHQKVPSGKIEIDFTAFQSGVYFVRLRNNNQVQTFRVLNSSAN